jgi:cell division protein FtsA
MVSTSQKIVVGIDVGSQMTRIIIAEETGKLNVPPKILGVGYSDSFGVRHGYVISPREVVASINEAVRIAEKSSNIEIRRAYVSAGGIGLSSEIAKGAVGSSRPDGEINEDDITNVISVTEQTFKQQKKNIKVLHTIPLKYRLDGIEVLGSPLGMRGSRLEIQMVFVMMQEHHFNDLVSVITDSGIDIIEIIASPIAESLATLTRRQRMVGCGLLNIGSETTSLVVFDNDLPVSVAVFPIGSSNITNDIALGLQIGLEEAEQIKVRGISHTKHPKKKYEEIVGARMREILEIVNNHLKHIKRDGLLPAGIIISGGGSLMTGFDTLIREELKLPASYVHEQVVMNTRRELDPSWLAVYGLCFLEDDEARYGTKFLKSAFRETKKSILKILREFLP